MITLIYRGIIAIVMFFTVWIPLLLRLLMIK